MQILELQVKVLHVKKIQAKLGEQGLKKSFKEIKEVLYY